MPSWMNVLASHGMCCSANTWHRSDYWIFLPFSPAKIIVLMELILQMTVEQSFEWLVYCLTSITNVGNEASQTKSPDEATASKHRETFKWSHSSAIYSNHYQNNLSHSLSRRPSLYNHYCHYSYISIFPKKYHSNTDKNWKFLHWKIWPVDAETSKRT